MSPVNRDVLQQRAEQVGEKSPEGVPVRSGRGWRDKLRLLATAAAFFIGLTLLLGLGVWLERFGPPLAWAAAIAFIVYGLNVARAMRRAKLGRALVAGLGATVVQVLAVILLWWLGSVFLAASLTNRLLMLILGSVLLLAFAVAFRRR